MAGVLERLTDAVGPEAASEQVSRHAAEFLISAVAGWYKYRYGHAPVLSAEYDLEVAGVASLLAPHIVDVPGDWLPATPAVAYPSAASVLGLM